MGKHQWQDEYRHLTDYTEYTDELDAQISKCTACGKQAVTYKLGKGFRESYKYHCDLFIDPGEAYMGVPMNDEFNAIEHPEWQLVYREQVYDENGYVIKFTVYWWYNGQRYSQVINCGPGEIEAWFPIQDSSGGRGCYQLRIFGTYIAPYKISWTG